ncbi:MAG: phosphoribosylanthranilate isomerase [Deltaproteobacteria bacterium]|jgi:phosphoribosylanthranilate isomerase|nr:phosphoribosylanthranilate isomerase [Deltaproteobacteria bacterium]
MPYIPKIKICGITNIDDAYNALNLGADTIGFIFYEKSKRYIPAETAKIIIKELRETAGKNLKNFLSFKRNIIITGVFVNENPEKIKKIARDVDIDIIQLSGNESLNYIEESGIDKNIILKAVHVKEEADLDIIYRYREAGVNVLVDAFVGEGEFGGTGVQINLDIMKNLNAGDLIIAGGIGHDNIELIIKSIKPYGIDLSSKIEDLPGKKNYDKMALFFKNFRRALYAAA